MPNATFNAIDLTELTEKRNRMGTLFYEDLHGFIIAKKCSKCDEVKELDGFCKAKRGLGGRAASCRECKAERDRQHHANNPEYYREHNRQHRANNPEYHREYNRQHRANNPEYHRERDRQHRANNTEYYRLQNQRRRARLASLPDTLTNAERTEAWNYFGNACALTGATDNIHLEHIIPISVGYGGTSLENCVPMDGRLNLNKHTHNIFDWYYGYSLGGGAKEHFNLEQWRFERLIDYLAELNGLTVEEYEEYTRWCHDNPRTIDEIKAEQTNEYVAIS